MKQTRRGFLGTLLAGAAAVAVAPQATAEAAPDTTMSDADPWVRGYLAGQQDAIAIERGDWMGDWTEKPSPLTFEAMAEAAPSEEQKAQALLDDVLANPDKHPEIMAKAREYMGEPAHVAFQVKGETRYVPVWT